VHGLLALMELQSSRLPARLNADGEPVPLLEQDRSRWDGSAIARGFEALMRAGAIPDQPYVLQAAIAACHAAAPSSDATDWVQIVTLYEALERLTPTPVVRLNHAVAVSWAYGPANGLRLVDTLLNLARPARLPPAAGGAG
jgi:predicted RNA polymerase sigma factor